MKRKAYKNKKDEEDRIKREIEEKKRKEDLKRLEEERLFK